MNFPIRYFSLWIKSNSVEVLQRVAQTISFRCINNSVVRNVIVLLQEHRYDTRIWNLGCVKFFFFFLKNQWKRLDLEPFDLVENFHGRPHFPSICSPLGTCYVYALENPLTFHSKVSFAHWTSPFEISIDPRLLNT